MVGVKSIKEDSSFIRKIRKPLVEKKRRDRMNTSINQLKSLIAHTIKQHSAPMTRVDKADILELTVYHLTQLQQQQQAVAMAAEVAAFNAGFKDCARETVTYLYNQKVTSGAVIGSLSNHLQVSIASNSRSRQYTQQTGHFSMTHPKNSTPNRTCNDSNLPLPDIHLQGYTPIQISQEVTSPYDYTNAGLSHSLHAASSSSGTSEVSMSYTDSTCSTSSSRMSYADDSTDQVEEVISNKDVVSIGEGKENEIGRLIKEVPWRPF